MDREGATVLPEESPEVFGPLFQVSRGTGLVGSRGLIVPEGFREGEAVRQVRSETVLESERDLPRCPDKSEIARGLAPVSLCQARSAIGPALETAPAAAVALGRVRVVPQRCPGRSAVDRERDPG